MKNSNGKLKISIEYGTVDDDSNGKLKISIEYGTVNDEVNKCDDECKGNCNNTCGTDARCRFNCYVEQCRCPGRKAFFSNGGI
uniref:Uncharacterized protein n=1 Tax=Panagrolaimus sp. PS1159 TaxID=55785 RepID=A0AC35GIB2_9BILA